MAAPLCNSARGEVVLTIDGAPHRLCLTLGVLAELECAFDVASIGELSERLRVASSGDLLIILAALLGGEAKGFDPSRLARAAIAPEEAVRAVSEAFRLAFSDA